MPFEITIEQRKFPSIAVFSRSTTRPTCRKPNEVATRNVAAQFTKTATEFADPRARDENSSETKNHGIEPESISLYLEHHYCLQICEKNQRIF